VEEPHAHHNWVALSLTYSFNRVQGRAGQGSELAEAPAERVPPKAAAAGMIKAGTD
jgi:hypothetical protein